MALADYKMGFADGARETLRQILGTSDIPGTHGPPVDAVTPELRAWAEQALERVDALDAGSGMHARPRG